MEQQRMPLQLITHSYACFVPSYKRLQQQNLLFSDKQNNLESIGESLSRIVLPKIQKRNRLIDMLRGIVEAMLFPVGTLH